MFIDSHAHISSFPIDDQLEMLLQRAQSEKVSHIVNICTNQETLLRGLELSSKYPWIFNTASTTPHDVDNEGASFFPAVEQAAREKKLVAIGETGLDYYYEHSQKENQKQYLIQYLQLALKYQLPVVIHCRDAFQDFFEILDQEYKAGGSWAPGVLHCFTGTLEEAKEVIKRGWYLSLSGIVTFKKSHELKEVARYVPLEQLLIETDTPYLAPQSKRGKSNEPSYLVETATCIADLKMTSLEELAKFSSENAKRLFSLPD